MAAEPTRRALILGALALGGCARVERVRQPLRFTVVNDRLLLDGVITRRSARGFEGVLAQNPQIATLVFQRVEGGRHLEDVLRLGTLIRSSGLTTALRSDSVVRGGGVDLFVAGVARRMVAGAVIDPSSRADPARRAYLRAMLGSDDFYRFTLRNPAAGGIQGMSIEDITRLGLLTEPVQELN
ncbi:hypothetical protein KDD17_05180 [Sulfitobacter albidus]|uniref:Uncharacterized protein n=1 Tax=Sulfitobacter albidus TaxID=2829501 RepID=A0A975JFA9_9RHOB|nr:hypothetical protein [Sulfitobacter albidus]QUJ77393.1 hypothetical protein KDD17_05180 [Sulfitobacter albidus]